MFELMSTSDVCVQARWRLWERNVTYLASKLFGSKTPLRPPDPHHPPGPGHPDWTPSQGYSALSDYLLTYSLSPLSPSLTYREHGTKHTFLTPSTRV